MKILLIYLFFLPLVISAQNPIDSLIYHVKKENNNKIIFFAEESKKELDRLGVKKSDEFYFAVDFMLFDAYHKNHNDKKAEQILLEIIKAREQNNLTVTKDYALALVRLANIYVTQFNFIKVKKIFDEVYKIMEKLNIKNTSFYANTLRIHAHSFIKQDSLVTAEKYLKESINVYNNLPERYDEDILVAYYDLSDVYISRKLFIKAKEVLETMLEITDNQKELNSNYYQILDLYTEYYIGRSNLEKAEEVLEESIRLKISEYGKDSELLIDSYDILFDISIRQSDFKKAEISLINSLRLIELIYRKHSTRYYIKLLTISAFYHEQYPDSKKASEYLFKFSLEFKNRLKNVASYYSNEEMDLYIKNNFYLRFFPLSFIHSANENYPKNNIEIFEIENLVKKFALKNNGLVRSIINDTGNQDLKKLYERYIDNKRELFELQSNFSNNNIDSLQEAIAKSEKQISNMTFDLKQPLLFTSDTFEKIKQKLSDDDIIVDLLNFYYFDKENGDNSKGVFDAFIIDHRLESPSLIKLFDDSELDVILKKNENENENDFIDNLYNKPLLSKLFVKPILKNLNNKEKVYVIYSGKSNQINFSAISLSDSLRLGEKFDVHLLGSSSEIINYSPIRLENKDDLELILYGDIDYNNIISETSKTIDSTSFFRPDNFIAQIKRSGINNWTYLPGTELEIKNIKEKSDDYGFNANIINQRKATKTSILNLDGKKSPFVLHLATHGFFFEGVEKESFTNQKNILPEKDANNFTKASYYKSSKDPMLRSGLLFAGVNKYWGGSIGKTVIDDGILTAKEISNLDLSNCQLVVLSACESGLGEIKGSEGVFGLQRSFKMAGVKNIIMSLWKVPDTQTAELFDLFYGYCFEGFSIHKSLKLAQSEMQKKYSPYYWAGFVLLE
jgi:CHAT domain-containing protein